MFTFPPNPVPGSEEGSWGQTLNTLLESLKSAIITLDSNKSPDGHNHDLRYSPKGHNHDEDYAPETHSHPVSQITGLNKLFTVLTDMDVNPPLLGNEGSHFASVLIRMSMADAIPKNTMLEWHLTMKWFNPSSLLSPILSEDFAYMSDKIMIQKPPSDSSVWSDSGKCVLKVTAFAENPFNGSMSNVSNEVSVEISVFNEISERGIAEALIDDTEMLSAFVRKIASNASLASMLKTALKDDV